MKYFFSLFLLFAAAQLSAADKYADLKTFLAKLDKIYTSYYFNLSNAASTEDVLKTVNTLADSMTAMKSEIKAINKKYPQLKQSFTTPEAGIEPESGIDEELLKIMEKFSAKHENNAAALNEKVEAVMQKYGKNEKVDAALDRLEKVLIEISGDTN